MHYIHFTLFQTPKSLADLVAGGINDNPTSYLLACYISLWLALWIQLGFSAPIHEQSLSVEAAANAEKNELRQ